MNSTFLTLHITQSYLSQEVLENRMLTLEQPMALALKVWP
jgi:hypothetical protein